MKPNFRLITVSVVGLLAVSCGSIPEVRYYMIEPPSQEKQSPADDVAAPVTVGIAAFDSSPIYEDDRIIYRDNPYEVKFYHYRRWVVAPAELVSEQIYEQFVASGAFSEVVRYGGGESADYVLNGDLLAFEEWDEKDTWYAQVGLRARLSQAGSGRVIWQDTLFKREPAAAKDPVHVVEAMSKALQGVVTEILAATRQAIEQTATADRSNPQ